MSQFGVVQFGAHQFGQSTSFLIGNFDSVVVSEISSIGYLIYRTLIDGASVTDTFSRGERENSLASDTITVVDTAEIILNRYLASIDTVTVTYSTLVSKELEIIHSDTLTSFDSLSTQIESARFANDSADTYDLLSIEGDSSRFGSDFIAIFDNTVKRFFRHSQVDELSFLDDSNFRTVDFIRLSCDVVGTIIGHSTNRTVTSQRTDSDQVSVADSTSHPLQYYTFGSFDTATLSDVTSVVVAHVRDSHNLAIVEDAPHRQTTQERIGSSIAAEIADKLRWVKTVEIREDESLGVLDDLTLPFQGSQERDWVDGYVLIDVGTTVSSYHRSNDDTTTLNDTAETIQESSRLRNDTSSVTDGANRLQNYLRSDSVTTYEINDHGRRIINSQRIRTEHPSVQDTGKVSFNYHVIASEFITLEDSTEAGTTNSKSVSEQQTTSDKTEVYLTANRSLDDNTVANDQLTLTYGFIRQSYDTIVLTDVPHKGRFFHRKNFDYPVRATDHLSKRKIKVLRRRSNETMSVEDTYDLPYNGNQERTQAD